MEVVNERLRLNKESQLQRRENVLQTIAFLNAKPRPPNSYLHTLPYDIYTVITPFLVQNWFGESIGKTKAEIEDMIRGRLL